LLRAPRPIRQSDTAASTKWAVVFPATLSVLAALLGAAVGGGVAAWSSANLQSEQLKYERGAAARSVRVEAYKKFLIAGDKAEDQRVYLWACISAPPATSDPENVRCAKEYEDGRTAAKDLERALDDILVYGSAEAVTLARRAFDAIVEYGVKYASIFLVVPRDGGGLSTPYPRVRIDFQKQMCRDLNPLPRNDC
jgi:hypothetical protein